MGWEKDATPAELSKGDTGEVEDIEIKVKTDDDGEVTDILVSDPDKWSDHGHIWGIDKPTSGVRDKK